MVVNKKKLYGNKGTKLELWKKRSEEEKKKVSELVALLREKDSLSSTCAPS